ncbi:DHH family phosphoesterase [Thalassobacillus pellis]|uniref:DHH family phosphoesterase n=1 Tax=Thalassobacillus pellis TaxID=748008 RepID=UPI00195F3A95|nr:bifunctional oligoribonuclease/PAP phosphatase NrnA [Thalassobacillus pellis]MBM7554974.1 phosphoesterase RecJ-like protein [Thalassobacillus pellis]
MCINQIFEKIKVYDTIIIHRHVRPDPDAYGSQAGLKEIIKASFPEKTVLLAGKQEPTLGYLADMDDVEDDTYHDALVIVCDTANEARICDQRYKQGKGLIKIDHHPNVDEYGDIQWVDTDASSTSELIYEFYLAKSDEGLTLPENGARLLYAGIVGDTGRFLFPSTTTKTLKYAADLVKYPFDRPALYNLMYNTKLPVSRLKGYILQNFTVTESGLSTVRISKEILDRFHVTVVETSQLVGMLGDVEGILAWAFFVEEDEIIRVRLRSKGPIVNKVAANHNGGGHPMASGATAYSWEETEVITEELEEVCKAYKNSQ